jgi:hypothetical protein
LCALADSPEDFAAWIVRLFSHPEEAAAMARRARAEVEAHRDMAVITRELEASYRRAVHDKRTQAQQSGGLLRNYSSM